MCAWGRSATSNVWRGIVVGLALALGLSGCQSSDGDVPPKDDQRVYLATRTKVAVALQLGYEWSGGSMSEAVIKLDKDHGWTDVVAVEDASHAGDFPDDVCVIWPGDDAAGIIKAFNWAINDANSDDDPDNDVDPGEFGLSYPLTVDMMWTHFGGLGDVFRSISWSYHQGIADGWD